jgi:hypothetical protein
MIITSLDTLLNFSKSVLLLLMDDEFEIRERNAKVVMRLVGEPNREVIPLYVQELFIDFLMSNLHSFNKHEVMAMVTIIVIDEDDNTLNENIVEYRVFEKSEMNIFGETFMIRKQCVAKLKTKIANEGSISDEISMIATACQKFTKPKSEAIVKSFLQTLTKD